MSVAHHEIGEPGDHVHDTPTEHRVAAGTGNRRPEPGGGPANPLGVVRPDRGGPERRIRPNNPRTRDNRRA